ncbi:tyrosine recombinase XerC [Nocardia sp. NPDC088792]|uniref:site-specific integrase n=1 Tax=Nocardia sp. NPDC088792 TaxID=3364332 RepID=UPI003805329C
MGAVALSGHDLEVLREAGAQGLRGRDRDEFWLWLSGRSFTDGTCEEYYKQALRFRKWLAHSDAHPDAFSDGPARDEAISAYLEEFPATHNLTLAAVRVFYEFLGFEGVRVDPVAKEQVTPGALSPREVSRVRAAAAARSARDVALVEVGLDVGPTTSELLVLNADDVFISARSAWIRLTGMDGQVRERELMRPTARVLEGWLAERLAVLAGRRRGEPRIRSERALFLSARRHRFEDDRGLRRAVAQVGVAAELEQLLNPARLRATAEARLLGSGMDPRAVAAWFGKDYVNPPRVRALMGAVGSLAADVEVGPAGEQLSLDLGV